LIIGLQLKNKVQTFIYVLSLSSGTMVGVAGDIFFQVGIVVIITALAAFLLRLLKQPQILAYVLVGILITPIFQLVTDTSIIEAMSIIGVAFLLFIVGLEMDLKALRNVAFVSSIGGAINIIILFFVGYLAALLLGFLSLEAAYIGLMLGFSSTMVVMKILSDRRELNTLHGRMVVGFLLLEDIVAIFVLSILTSINGFTLGLFLLAMAKFLSLFAVAFLLSKYIFPRVFRFAAKQQELLLISSLAVCFLFSLAFQYLGFSIAIGAFIAGITLGNLEYNLDIIGKVKSLRDFFALLFFVSLGMGLSLGVIQRQWVPILVLLLIIIVLKPFLIMTVCSLFKFTKKPAFLTATALTQIGEFSLIIAAQGLALGHVSQNFFSMIVIITLISITLTPYFIQHQHFIYKLLQRPLQVFDFFTTQGGEYLPREHKPSIVLCGHNRIGYSILQRLKKVKDTVLVVDYNPEIIDKVVKQGYHSLYGDVTDEEILERMNIAHLALLVSTVPDVNDNIQLIRKVKAVNQKAKVIVTANDIDESLKLYRSGADYVILPHFLGGEQVARIITDVQEKKLDLHKEREKHIYYLYERKGLGHRHPKI